MIKYCKSCGKEYRGKFCEHCGYGKEDVKIKAYDKYKVEKPERFMTDEEKAAKSESLRAKREEEKRTSREKSQNRTRPAKASSQWGFIITAVVIFAVVVLLALYKSGFIGQTKDKTEVIDRYFSSIDNGDFDGYLSTMIAPMAEDYRSTAKEMGISDEDAMDELYSDYIEGFGEGYTVTVEFGAEAEMSSAEIKSSENTLYQAYGKNYDIKEAYRVAVNVTFKGTKAEETQDMYVYVGKIKGKWYILNIDN